MPPFDWLEYLELARQLSKSDKEAALRSAISRAYYAAFNQVRAYCVSREIYIPRAVDSHQVVWDKFKEGRTLRGVYTNGDLLKQQRVLADYKSEPIERLEDTVAQAIRYADRVLYYLNQPAAAPPATH
jgi:uncharacterized protein (UPF0332 family)